VTLREITAPVDLCRPDGRLAPEAVGWTRRPLHRPNLRGWGRTKRWEYWGVVLESHVIGLTISSLDYAGVESVYLLDRSTGLETVREVTAPLARGVRLAPGAGRGSSRFRGAGLDLAFTEVPDGCRLQARFDDVEVDLLASRVPGQESLGVVVPWSERRFQYTVKDVCRPVSGAVRVGATTYAAEGGWAVLDHGRGKWPYAMRWNWAAGSGMVEGEVRGLQLGGRWTEGTGSTENALLVGTRLHKLHDEVEWRHDPEDWLRPWHITGPRLEVRFTPYPERAAATNLLVVASRTHQCFGEFTGWATDDDGVRVRLDGLTGWAEEVRNRW
jgi:hypothetical protein